MTNDRVLTIESASLATDAIRTAKAAMQEAGKCDGQCTMCLPDRLHECIALHQQIRHETEQALGISG